MMPKITKMLRDLHTLRSEIRTELARIQFESPEQLAALCVESYEDGFTAGMNRGGLKSKPPKDVPEAGPVKSKPTKKKRKRKRKISPGLAALNLHRKVRGKIVKALKKRSMSRGQLVEATGLDPELISECIQKEKGKWFLPTPGHRWMLHPDMAAEAMGTGERRGSTFKAVIAGVMKRGKTHSPQEILALLQAEGVAPDSKDPLSYVNHTLYRYQDMFERLGRGRYTVR